MAEYDQVIPRANTENLYAQFNTGVAAFKVIANRDHGTIYQDAQYIPLLKAFVAGQPLNDYLTQEIHHDNYSPR
jgi:hypothetical protein